MEEASIAALPDSAPTPSELRLSSQRLPEIHARNGSAGSIGQRVRGPPYAGLAARSTRVGGAGASEVPAHELRALPPIRDDEGCGVRSSALRTSVAAFRDALSAGL